MKVLFSILLLLVLSCSLVPVWCADLKFVFTNSRLPRLSSYHAAVYDGEDSIYIICGWNGETVFDSVMKYSLISGSVETIGTFIPRIHGGAVLQGKDILYLGGFDGLTNEGGKIGRASCRERV